MILKIIIVLGIMLLIYSVNELKGQPRPTKEELPQKIPAIVKKGRFACPKPYKLMMEVIPPNMDAAAVWCKLS